MGRFERLFQLNAILRARRTPIALRELQERLECSRATSNRDIRDLRNHLHAPILYDRERNGYLLDRSAEPAFELPGLWFNPEELYALMTSWHLLRNLQPGILSGHIEPLISRIEQLVGREPTGSAELAARVRILQMAPRQLNVEQFRRLVDALVQRRRVRILYHGRARDRTTERTISPQRRSSRKASRHTSMRVVNR